MYDSVYSEFKASCRRSVEECLKGLDLADEVEEISLAEPPSREFGELSTSVCFDLAKRVGDNPLRLAEKILEHMEFPSELIKNAEVAGNGYINFRLNFEKASRLILAQVIRGGSSYGFVKTSEPRRIIVEHTSVNPVHPIHIGQARNPILGDAIARLLKRRGHMVKSHYYIDDMGRQSAILAYGYKLLGEPPIMGKPDHFLGRVYSVTSCLIEVESLKRRIRRLTELGEEYYEDVRRLRDELDDWVRAAAELRDKYPEIFDALSKAIIDRDDPESEVSRLIKEYDDGEGDARRLIRKVSGLCLEGFKATLRRLDICFDSWDWESDLVWSGMVKTLLEKLKSSRYVRWGDGTIELDVESIIEDLDLRDKLKLREAHHLPSLTLIRSDGTTLYTTRDIAYSLYKFEGADRVINVIGAEQSLAQLQLKAALYALGEHEKAENLIHFSFGLVEMPGRRMSSRRGRIITLDEVLDEALARAYEEVRRRDKISSDEEVREIAGRIGLASVKYALISVEPVRTVTFTWDRVLDFEKNSAPFINYAYTRALGILRKFRGEVPAEVEGEKLTHPLERKLLLQIAKFPEEFIEAADNLKPNAMANYANSLAESFHEYYEKVNVIGSREEALRVARAALVKSVAIVLGNSMEAIGIKLSERM
ncbi:MAG: arginine--tRNA ligase [Candidatus Bathyarchaeia archaeon]|nr:arginine--tRNA ligase [Candidatus Bathyarchaeota archaeon]